jgi:hypothetical protein
MSGLIDYHNGIYAFDAGYVRPLLAAIHLIESEGPLPPSSIPPTSR